MTYLQTSQSSSELHDAMATVAEPSTYDNTRQIRRGDQTHESSRKNQQPNAYFELHLSR
jgi:hypothetical protein